VIPGTPDVVVRRSVVGSPTGIVIFAGVNFQFATAISMDGCAFAGTAPANIAANERMAAAARRDPTRVKDAFMI
jgi:hypothetical protein